MSEQIPAEIKPQLVQNEQIFWQRFIKKGIIRKKVVQVQVITNMAVRLNKQWLRLTDIDAIVLTDRHTISDSTYHGYSFRMGGGMRASTGRGRGRGTPFADMVFFHKGNAILTLDNVQDAGGIKQLIQAANPHIR